MMNSYKSKLITLIGMVFMFLSYSIKLYLTPIPEKQPASTLAQEGKIIWQEKNCSSCHQLYGLGGHLGPDLTNVAGKRTREYISAFLKTGTKVMPNFKLTDNEMQSLQAFLEYTHTTGESNPTTFKKNFDGSIEK